MRKIDPNLSADSVESSPTLGSNHTIAHLDAPPPSPPCSNRPSTKPSEKGLSQFSGENDRSDGLLVDLLQGRTFTLNSEYSENERRFSKGTRKYQERGSAAEVSGIE